MICTLIFQLVISHFIPTMLKFVLMVGTLYLLSIVYMTLLIATLHCSYWPPGTSCLKNCYTGKLVMLKMLHGCMLLHLGLGYQLLERVLLLKVSNSFIWKIFRIYLCSFVSFWLSFSLIIEYTLIIFVLLALNLQDILQIEYLLLFLFIRAKLHSLWLLFSQLSPSWMYGFLF